MLVTATVFGEFWRGGRVIARQSGVNILSGMVTITRRNTRRYGGYLVHFGVILIVIGFAGLPFNLDKEQEMGVGDKMQIGQFTLVCESYAQDPAGNTEDSRPNYDSDWAVITVLAHRQVSIGTMYPRAPFLHRQHEQTSTIVANRSASQRRSVTWSTPAAIKTPADRSSRPTSIRW